MKTGFRFPFRSLRLRLSMAFTLLVAVLLLVADASLIGYVYYAASSRTNRALERSLVLVQSTLTNEVGEVDEAKRHTQGIGNTADSLALPVAEALRELETVLGQERITALITDEAGHIWRSAALGGAPSLERRSPTNDGWRIRTMRVRLSNNDQGDRAFFITVGAWWPATQSVLRTQALLLSALTLFMVLIAGGGAFALIGRTLKPIDRLAQQAHAQANAAALPAGEHLTLTPPSPDAEVVNLVTTLNQLLHAVSETAAMKSRFYTAASHELRGPLQVLAGRVELTLSLPRSREDYQAALIEVQEQADHLIALVQSLLLMNRLERAGMQTFEPESFAIAPLCRSQINALAPQIQVRHLTVEVDASLQKMPDVYAASASHGEFWCEIYWIMPCGIHRAAEPYG